jgi:hypothetical protein
LQAFATAAIGRSVRPVHQGERTSVPLLRRSVAPAKAGRGTRGSPGSHPVDGWRLESACAQDSTGTREQSMALPSGASERNLPSASFFSWHSAPPRSKRTAFSPRAPLWSVDSCSVRTQEPTCGTTLSISRVHLTRSYLVALSSGLKAFSVGS